MIAQRHFIFWGAACAVFFLLVFLFKPVLLPFVLGTVIAYLLNPVVNSLGRLGIGRGLAALLIVSAFFLAAGIVIAVIAPIAAHELLDLSKDLPVYIERLKVFFQPATDRLHALLGEKDAGQQAQAMVGEHAGAATAMLGSVVGGLALGGQAFLNFVTMVVVTPVVAYFMIREWPQVIAWLADLLPRARKDVILGLLAGIDRKLSGFIHGQVIVAAILAVSYAAALSVAGLEYGFLIGLVAGLLSVIPVMGSAFGFVAGVLAAWVQTGGWEFPALVAGIFIAGQLIEGNLLIPKIVGGRLGLHPLWIFFALMAGGSLLGILGMLLAVPVAAIASVLLAFAIREYKASAYYRGEGRHG